MGYPSVTVSVPPDRQGEGEEAAMETPPEGLDRTENGTPGKRVQTESGLGQTSTGSYLEDFIADFDSTVEYDGTVKMGGESDDESLGSGPDIYLGEPPIGWTKELGLPDSSDYREELIQATTGLLKLQGVLPPGQTPEGEVAAVPQEDHEKEETSAVPQEEPEKEETSAVPQEEPEKEEISAVPQEEPAAVVQQEQPGGMEPVVVPQEKPEKEETEPVPQEQPVEKVQTNAPSEQPLVPDSTKKEIPQEQPLVVDSRVAVYKDPVVQTQTRRWMKPRLRPQDVIRCHGIPCRGPSPISKLSRRSDSVDPRIHNSVYKIKWSTENEGARSP